MSRTYKLHGQCIAVDIYHRPQWNVGDHARKEKAAVLIVNAVVNLAIGMDLEIQNVAYFGGGFGQCLGKKSWKFC